MTTQVKPPPAITAAAPPATAATTPAATPAAAAPPALARKPRKFTAEEYLCMVEADIFAPKERVELIDGEVLVMAPMGPEHFAGITAYIQVFRRLPIERFSLLVRAPLGLDEYTAPEPDLALLKFRADDYWMRRPGPADTLLVIEVAKSSLAYDREVKAHIYGRAGIPETWVLNLPEDCIERFTAPGPQGYARHEILRRGDKVSPIALPDLELAVDELLPPVAVVE